MQKKEELQTKSIMLAFILNVVTFTGVLYSYGFKLLSIVLSFQPEGLPLSGNTLLSLSFSRDSFAGYIILH